MKKVITYREKLLELARIYNISEVRNYIKVKKNLTVLQLELILKKNKVPVPKEIHKNILEIQSKKIIKPFYEAFNKTNNFCKNSILTSKKKTVFLFKNTNNLIFKNINNLIQSIINSFNKLCSSINKKTISALNHLYNFKVQEEKANTIVASLAVVTVSISLVMFGLEIFKNFDNDKNLLTEKSEKKTNPILKKEPKKKIVKIPEKKEPKKNKPKLKEPNQLSELILPNLNLKTETVLNLFADVKYDLRKVRDEKKVKPIYFTQFPKDLDEIQSVQLKKETFIKIILPLVVAENQKISDDRYKLKKIMKVRITSDKEKSWLRQKFREYKVKNGDMKELNKRMDIIPVSIALAQAAKESGWGTSRFALEGNAIFGQWTWNGKGIEPLLREEGQTYKILRFPILRASVKAYKNNLNTHKGYREFRDKRNQLRQKNKNIKGLKLIHTLDSYAQTGKEYTKILEQIIEQNSLFEFEEVKLTTSVEKKEINL